MIKRELEEIKELERYIEKITYEEEVISQLK